MQVFNRSNAPAVIVAVAVGGAIGAAGRWGVAWLFGEILAAPAAGTWPWATLAVNIVGCALIGFAARSIERESTSWAFVVTGLLGGFTTFSALAVELNDMADADRLGLGVLYAMVTLVAGVGATALADPGPSTR